MTKIFKIFVILLLSCCSAQMSAATHYSTHLKNIAQQILLLTDQEKLLNNKIEQLNKEQLAFQKNPPADYQKAVQLQNQIKMRMEMTGMLVDELSQSLSNVQQRANTLLQSQKNLQVQLLNEQIQTEKINSMNRLHFMSELIALNQKENDLLTNNLALAKQLSLMYQQYSSDCLMLVESIDKKQSIQVLHQKVIMEQKSTDYWLQKINELNNQRAMRLPRENNTLIEQIIDESHLFYYTQQINLSSIKVVLLESDIRERKTMDEFKNLALDVSNSAKMSELKDSLDDSSHTLQDALNALSQYQQLMKKQEILLQNSLKNNWLKANNAKGLKKNLDELEGIANTLQKVLIEKQKIVQGMQLKLQNYTSQMVAKRQAILQTNENVVVGFVSQLAEIPKLLRGYIIGLCDQVWHGMTLIGTWFQLLISTILLFTLLVWWLGKKYFHILSNKMSKSRQRTSSNIVYILSELFYRNWGSLCLFLDSWFILSLSGINFNAYVGLFYTAIIWFTFRVIMGIARIVLVERGSNTQGHDVILYHRLKWVFIVGGWVTVFVALSKQFGMSGIIFDLSNRLFMAFLLTVSIVLIRARNVIPSLLDPVFANRKYLSRTIRTVCWLFPFGFFVSTALGVLGYMNLSWLLIYYQAALVLVIASYMILRGISTDFFEISSELMIRRLNQGWLWSEAFLKPLDRLFRIFLFLAMIFSIFFILGWRDDSLVVTKMREVFDYPFFYFSGINVTLFSIIELIALVSFCFWAAKWTREFSYRWVFRNAKDIGIRNSLAVFCQYLVIALGTIITLRTLGIDFTGLSMILGGLAVGLGFGLRDLASNIVGGIMLLIERSVKEGDIISIGTYEGEVMHIGIRAMRIRSWDHMEIMVPNSEILMKTFMNWTHQDSIVRTVIPMKMHRVDDSYSVQTMILETIKNIPEILLDPEAEVLFTQLDGALIEFEVRYFINIALHARPKIRSKAVLAILERFKASGLRPPYSQQDSYVWDIHAGSDNNEYRTKEIRV